MAPHSSTLAWRIPWTEEPTVYIYIYMCVCVCVCMSVLTNYTEKPLLVIIQS